MKLKSTLLAVALGFGLNATAQELSAEQASIDSYNHSKLSQLHIEMALAPVKNKMDLEELLSRPSPLDKLSSYNKESFVNSVTFGENGVSGFSMIELEDELTVSEIYKVLALFGMQSGVSQFDNARVSEPVDMLLLKQDFPIVTGQKEYKPFLEGYICVERGSCMEQAGSVCTANC